MSLEQRLIDLATAIGTDMKVALDRTTDGNMPVPATGTVNNGKVLTAGATANSASWQSITKDSVGLGNVDNTSDVSKNVLSATKLTTPVNINGVSFDGTSNITISDSTKIASTEKGAANGVASLGSDGKVPVEQLPSTGGTSMLSAVLTDTQTNSTVTPAILTDHTFTIPPGKTANIQGILVFTSAGTIKGAFYGVRVTQGAGANGNAVGSWRAYVNISSAATANGLADGDVFNLAGGESTPAGAGVLGTATVAGNNSAKLSCIIKNNSTNANTTVNIMFRSEVAGSAVTAQIGTSASCIVG